METQILIGIIGLVGVYIVYRIFSVSPRVRPMEAEQYDILNDEKYKVKGQWDR